MDIATEFLEESVYQALPLSVDDTSSSVESCCQPSSSNISSTPVATSSSASGKSKFISPADRCCVVKALQSLHVGEATVLILRTAAKEKHISFFIARKEALENNQDTWTRIVNTLLATFTTLFQNCSSRTDKYFVFQIQWNSAVREFTLSDPDLTRMELPEMDKVSLLHAVAAATWTHACTVVKRTIEQLRDPSNSLPDHASADERKFSEDHVHRFFGAALHKCIRVLKEKEKRQSGRMNEGEKAKLGLFRAIRLEKEEKEVANLPAALRIRDRGWMTFLKDEYLPFADHAMKVIFDLVNQDTYERYGPNLIKQATTSVSCDQSILKNLDNAVTKMLPGVYSTDTVCSCGEALVTKVLRAVVEEVVDSKEQMQVLASGEKSTSGRNLRDRIHIANA